MNRYPSMPLILIAAVLLMGIAFSAYATPTEQQITQARADCHARKVRVRALEASGATDNRIMRQERVVWEHTCALATAMMDERDGKVVPQPVASPTTATSAEMASFENCNESGRNAEPKAP